MPWCLVETMSTLLVPRVQTVRKRFGQALAFQEYTSESHTRFCFVFKSCFVAATVRGALRAEREDLLTVVLPQSLEKQTKESQELLEEVDDLITMPQNDDMPLDVASRICNSYLLSLTDQLISFAFHESTTVIEANKEAKALDMLVTTLYLD